MLAHNSTDLVQRIGKTEKPGLKINSEILPTSLLKLLQRENCGKGEFLKSTINFTKPFVHASLTMRRMTSLRVLRRSLKTLLLVDRWTDLYVVMLALVKPKWLYVPPLSLPCPVLKLQSSPQQLYLRDNMPKLLEKDLRAYRLKFVKCHDWLDRKKSRLSNKN